MRYGRSTYLGEPYLLLRPNQLAKFTPLTFHLDGGLTECRYIFSRSLKHSFTLRLI